MFKRTKWDTVTTFDKNDVYRMCKRLETVSAYWDARQVTYLTNTRILFFLLYLNVYEGVQFLLWFF